MSKQKAILIILVILAASFFYWRDRDNEPQRSAANLQVQENTLGPVTITVIPENIFSISDMWVFKVTMNTHSRNLDEDLVAATTLFAGGDTRKPVSWDGDGPEGHHREGVLKFEPVFPLPNTLELKIQSAEGERTFRWKLK